MQPRRLLCVLAHPDDESLGVGGTLVHYASQGVATYVLTATRGERGWHGDAAAYPGQGALGRIREAELRAAAQVLGVREVRLLDYCDGDLDQAKPHEAITAIAGVIRDVRPQVVITFGPDGGTGHPDHIAISQFTTAAVVQAAACADVQSRPGPHQVDKLYYMVDTNERIALYDRLFGNTFMTVDGVHRRFEGWPTWAITTRLDTAAYWRTVWRAIGCHVSQIPDYQALGALPEDQHILLWGVQEYYRVFGTPGAARERETDLFAGLEGPTEIVA